MSTSLLYWLGSIADTLWAVSWQAAALGMLVWGIIHIFRTTPTVFRYWLWMIVFMRLCIPMGFSLPDGIERIFAEKFSASEFAAPIRQVASQVMQSSFGEIDPSESFSYDEPRVIDPPIRITTGQLAGGIWLVSVFILAISIALRAFVLNRRISTRAEIHRPELTELFFRLKASLGIQKLVRLRYFDPDESSVPAVAGVRNPSVLLPERIADVWPLADIEPVLLHELAHVKRGDLLLNWFQVVVQAVYFFNPFVWYVNSRLRRYREELSDDLAVYHLESGRRQYAASIMCVMESVLNEPIIGFAGIGFSEHKHSLGWRIERMLKSQYDGYKKMSSKMIVVIACVMILGTFTTLLPVACLFDSDDNKHETVYETEISSEKGEPGLGELFPTEPIPTTTSLKLGLADGTAFDPPPEAVAGCEHVVASMNRFVGISDTRIETVDLGSSPLSDIHVLFVSAKGAFSLTEAESQNLGAYISNGGFAIFDSPEPELLHSQSEESLRNMLRKSLGESITFLPISNDHMLNHVFFDFMDGACNGMDAFWAKETQNVELIRPTIEGVWIGSRLAAVFSEKGYIYAWNNEQGPPLKYGVNMVLFGALQKDGILHRQMI